jgi:hypothetical protein
MIPRSELVDMDIPPAHGLRNKNLVDFAGFQI